ncbi:unnamed protein product [Closterium sp. Yama58-4]|nr:unnamed protein product [Closterium sp. Yama58-4]
MQLSTVVSQWRQDDRLADKIMEITAIAEESGGGDGKSGVDASMKCGEKSCSGGCGGGGGSGGIGGSGGSGGSGASDGSGEPIGLRQSCSLPELCPIPAVDWRVCRSHRSHGSDHSRGSSGELELPFSVPPRSNSSSDPQLTSQLSSELSSQLTSPLEQSSEPSVAEVSSRASRAIRSQSHDSGYFHVSRQEVEQNRQKQQHIKGEQRRPLERINDSDTRASPFDGETRREQAGGLPAAASPPPCANLSPAECPPCASPFDGETRRERESRPPSGERPPCAHAFYGEARRDTSRPAVSPPPCASLPTIDLAPCASLLDKLCAFPSDSSCSSDVFADGSGGGVGGGVGSGVSGGGSGLVSGAVSDGGEKFGVCSAAVIRQPVFPPAAAEGSGGVSGGGNDAVSDCGDKNGLCSAAAIRQPVFPAAAAEGSGGGSGGGNDAVSDCADKNGLRSAAVIREPVFPAAAAAGDRSNGGGRGGGGDGENGEGGENRENGENGEGGESRESEENGENGEGENGKLRSNEAVLRQAIFPALVNISSGPGPAVATGCGDSGRNVRAGSWDGGRFANGCAREVPPGVPRGVSLGSSEERARRESAGGLDLQRGVDSLAEADPGSPVQMDGNGEIVNGKNANEVGLSASPSSSRLRLRLRPPFAIAVTRRRPLSERSDLGPANHASPQSACREPRQEASCLRGATDSPDGGLSGGLSGGVRGVVRQASRDAQAAAHSPHSVADFPMFSSPRVETATLVDARGEATRVETTRFDPERSSRPLRSRESCCSSHPPIAASARVAAVCSTGRRSRRRFQSAPRRASPSRRCSRPPQAPPLQSHPLQSHLLQSHPLQSPPLRERIR